MTLFYWLGVAFGVALALVFLVLLAMYGAAAFIAWYDALSSRRKHKCPH